MRSQGDNFQSFRNPTQNPEQRSMSFTSKPRIEQELALIHESISLNRKARLQKYDELDRIRDIFAERSNTLTEQERRTLGETENQLEVEIWSLQSEEQMLWAEEARLEALKERG